MDLNNRRRHLRKDSSIPVEYSVNILEFRELKKIHRSAVSTDISDKGIGLITDYPLEPGHVLILSSRDSALLQKIAIVRWTMQASGSYRIGLEFV
jgi:hypothetical protein